METGDTVDETGLLLRAGAAFWLQRDAGGRFALLLRRVPVDTVEKRVRVIGVYAGDGTAEVDGVQPA